jgi:carbon-monoxide dehydrogenase large subunit
MKFALGQAVPRTEDPRLLTGRGRYIDDFVLPRLAHAYMLRSPHAHARIRAIDTRAAPIMSCSPMTISSGPRGRRSAT